MLIEAVSAPESDLLEVFGMALNRIQTVRLNLQKLNDELYRGGKGLSREKRLPILEAVRLLEDLELALKRLNGGGE